MSDTDYFDSFDGERIAFRELGAGFPVILLHGYFSNADTNWVRYGHAGLLAEAGFRVIMPDLRGHGDSAKPHDKSAYPPDALAKDGLALIGHLGLTEYHLAGYSLGARTVVRMLVAGVMPKRVILSGMGLEGLIDTGKRAGHFHRILTNLGSFERGTPEWLAEAFLKTTGGDPQALLGVLGSFVDTPREAIAAIDRPVLVLAGEDDDDNGSHRALAALIPGASHDSVPGNHMGAVTKPDLGAAMAKFLAA